MHTRRYQPHIMDIETLAKDAFDTMMPLLIIHDLRVCGVYHDPAKNKPNEVMYLGKQGWEAVIWADCQVFLPMRCQTYHLYCEPRANDRAFINVMNSIITDRERVPRDAEYMLNVIKHISPEIVVMMNDASTCDYIGSRIKHAHENPSVLNNIQ